MAVKYQIIRPRSLTDSVYEEFEYLLRWIGRDGAEYLYMFYDAKFTTQIKTNVVNSENSDRIESLIDSEKREVELTADNLSKNDLLVIGEMLASKYVIRLKKDGTTERYALDSNSYKYRIMNYRYKVTFTLMLSEVVTWK